MDSKNGTPTRNELVALDIDLRLHDLVVKALARTCWDGAILASYLRFAYGAGYYDALTESERGQLCRDHGFVVPTRQQKS